VPCRPPSAYGFGQNYRFSVFHDEKGVKTRRRRSTTKQKRVERGKGSAIGREKDKKKLGM
jgi:hypothetical protein